MMLNYENNYYFNSLFSNLCKFNNIESLYNIFNAHNISLNKNGIISLCDFMIKIPNIIKFTYIDKTYTYALMCKYDLTSTTDKNILIEILPSYENKLRSLEYDRNDL